MSDADATDVQRWQAPSMDAAGARSGGNLMTAGRLADVESQARAEGIRQGIEEGRQQGLALRQKEVRSLQQILNSLSPQVQILDEALLEQLAALVLAIARQFIRRELRQQPGEIVRVVRDCLAALPAAESRIRLFLHPEDVALVKEAMHPEAMERPWQLIEDPSQMRGGARLETDSSTVDASVETRLNAIAAELLGDEREGV